ncbi:glycosyltransferase family 4 protein [Chloroflexota bacterium]
MNICLAIISDTWAGAETVAHELARHLRDRGENVFIALNREIYDHYTDLENVRLINVGSLFRYTGLINACISPKVGIDEKQGPPDSFPGSFYLDAALREIYYKRIQSPLAQTMMLNKIDIIHSHLNAGIVLISNLPDDLGIPVVATLHGQSSADMVKRSRIGWLKSPVGSWRRERLIRSLGKARAITAVSDAELEAVNSCDIPVKDKSIVIPNGINVSEVQSNRSSTGLKGEFNLLFPGGARLVKGGDLIIAALPEVRRVLGGMHLYIAGEVPKNHALREMVAARGLDENVTFTGLLGVQEYRQMLNSVDLLVMPSREESFGIAFLEAMALGKPVIGSNRGGVPTVVKDGRNGVLVEPAPDQIAEAIIYLYRNVEERQEMSRNSLGDVTAFDWGDIVGRYIALYREIESG